LFETLLLLATCVWIFYEVVKRLFFAEVHVDPSPWAFAVMVVSIVVDYTRSRALARTAKKYQSQALEADALHFSTDIWSSAVVIGGLGLVLLSEKLGIAWLAKADAVAAAVVACIVVYVSAKLGKRTIDELLDAVPPEFREKVLAGGARAGGPRRAAGAYPQERSGDLRRRHPDGGLRSEPGAGARHRSEAETAIRRQLPNADVVVHTEPVVSGQEGLLATVRVLAARHGLGAHGIRVYAQERRFSLELHLEVDEALRVREAHEKVTQFEGRCTRR